MTALLSACTTNGGGAGNGSPAATGTAEAGGGVTATAANTDQAGGAPASDSGLKGVVDGLPVPSLAGKTIGISVIGTQDNNDRQAYQGRSTGSRNWAGQSLRLTASGMTRSDCRY